jgi:hypothetical protein
MECKFCGNTFTTKTSINHHQKTAKYCLEIRGEYDSEKYKCDCGKNFGRSYELKRHKLSCKSILISKECLIINEEKNKTIEKQQNMLEKKNMLIQLLELQLKTQREQYETQISNLQDKLENIALKAIERPFEDETYKEIQKDNKSKDNRIKLLEKKYLKRHSRIEYKEKYVIYILTTRLMQKERRYIMGKATNLTKRLSTYNKSDEHRVVYHQGCGDEETMSLVENLVFHHLQKYREQANRERFILPENEKISLFSSAIQKSIEYCKNQIFI